MKKYRSYILLSLILIFLSAGVYSLQVISFHDLHTTLFYLLQDVAFLPLQILLGVLIIDRIIQRREKARLLRKLNMVIGVFFMETGDGILCRIAGMLNNRAELSRIFMITPRWTKREYADASAALHKFYFNVQIEPERLQELHNFLKKGRDGLLRLLENPNLLEHERFTDLLWAVSHLGEELHCRKSFDALSAPDAEHLKGDMIRAYRLLLAEWLSYMKHLQSEYPYLFSLAVRTNPFDEDAQVEIKPVNT